MVLRPSPLQNDCFALPDHAIVVSVSDALAHLRKNLRPLTGVESVDLTDAKGRILAGPAVALQAHPPAACAAVDGYALRGPLAQGSYKLPLVIGRALASQPFDGTVPPGHAVQIFSGAPLPAGTDTVVRDSDVVARPNAITLAKGLPQGCDVRRAGEDMAKGDFIFAARRALSVRDIATLSAVGAAKINVRKRLRVGILSVGDELIEPGQIARPGQIYDANRAMLRATLESWGYDVVDLGIVPDAQDATQTVLDRAADNCHVVITSGGASTPDSNPVAALLGQTGTLAQWHIAMEPSHPLALGLWRDVPVMSLPGDPVAACVSTLMIARPALSTMAGGNWLDPIGFDLPAAFTKTKKPGQRQFLRAKLTDESRVDLYPCDDIGRISSLSWATGLVELPEDTVSVQTGDMVRFMPFCHLGI